MPGLYKLIYSDIATEKEERFLSFMKKTFLLSCLLLNCCISCNTKKNNKENITATVTPVIRIDSLISEIFVKKYPSYNSNEFLRETAVSEFLSTFKTEKILISYISEFIFKLDKIKRYYVDDKQYLNSPIAQFHSIHYYSNNDIKVDINIVGVVKPELAKTLIQGNSYKLYVHRMEQITPKLAATYFEEGYKTSVYTGFNKASKTINLGCVLSSIDSVVIISSVNK